MLALTIIFCALILCSSVLHSFGRDTISVNSWIIDGETLVSTGERFELGFFTPAGSSNNRRYVGIWYYKMNPTTVVWVANRDSPLTETGGFFALHNGNLAVLDKSGKPYWSTNLESLSLPKEAKLMDSGNFVLRNQSGVNLWQSFEQPTDTFISGMKMDYSITLTSWTSQYNPKRGDFTLKLDQAVKQLIIYRNLDIRHWRSETSGEFFQSDELPPAVDNLLFNRISRQPSNYSNTTYNNTRNLMNYNNTRIVMNLTGEIQYWSLDTGKNKWNLMWKKPTDRCSFYDACGSFGSCNTNNALACKCLPGYRPKFQEDWDNRVFSGGCVRNSICGKNDTFLNLKKMQVGNTDLKIEGYNDTDCRKECLGSCLCVAYSLTKKENSKLRDKVPDNSTCWIWKEDLKHLQDNLGGHDLFVRVASSDLKAGSFHKQFRGGSSRKKAPLLLILGVTIACTIAFSIVIALICIRRRMVKRKVSFLNSERAENIKRNAAVFYGTEKRVKDLIDCEDLKEEDQKGIDVPFFDLDSIIAATDNFSDAKKLGRGGFGPVYKGIFPGGQEIAVKRLLSVSGQGLEEFKNEVVLIARLQHRNLVRLLGYCIKGHEKILLYEYMPNKSLDFFVFDRKLGMLLNWETRFNIILGVARGLLYLHQDSRLRIIHRDLKTSNILLDSEMNPKISDFGLARIFEGKQVEGSTNRVVGTYGYMSPEYALDGLFSVKSDAFSFGIVVLEILSGRRSIGVFKPGQDSSLLSNVWKLWRQDQALDFLDDTLSESVNSNEFIKCLHVALLCVQDNPADRPNMSNVVIMLSSETTGFPTPKKPAFVERKSISDTASSSSNQEISITGPFLSGGR
ncbi:G-type lectin S-receptor-like serine/threonine-protein kinase At4g03230 isoform X2 [Jatropha curcas]|uniref:G-type lectin S-receptor-like serine/threonine-protein kinase At4g03230 isoform X2 n=1 Tax=Jatropha curcas TaxID=180498 RepID=UPI001894F9BD|nr:G-type lectin S-receptor-like serine/threonine-protein kinase At4g03230 isoform X2 [Jatropha curcas]